MSEQDSRRYVKKGLPSPAETPRRARLRNAPAEDTAEPVADPRRRVAVVGQPQGQPLAQTAGRDVLLPTDRFAMPVQDHAQSAQRFEMPDFGVIRADLARRRRNRLVNAVTRFTVFVLLPTFMAWTYFASLATPQYASEATFVIKSGDSSGPSGSSLAQTMSGSGTAHDAMAIQGWLESRNALDRLEHDFAFREVFSSERIDPLQRLPTDATREDVYELYGKRVTVGFDPTEGIVKLQVLSPEPALSQAWAEALIGYAQDRVEAMTTRIREDRLSDAQANMNDAQAHLTAATDVLVALQEELAILSSLGEERIIADSLSSLEVQIGDARIERDALNENRRPNTSRLAAIDARIASLEAEVARRRAMTGAETGTSLAAAQGRLEMARSEVENRRELRAEAMRQLEAARIEAARQSRYVTVGIAPTATDEPFSPKPAQDTLVFFLAMLAIYGGVTLTAAMIKDQITA